MDILLWLKYYSSLVVVLATKFLEHIGDFMAYQTTIIKTSKNFEGAAWTIYDRCYRRWACLSDSEVHVRESHGERVPRQVTANTRTPQGGHYISSNSLLVPNQYQYVSMQKSLSVHGNQAPRRSANSSIGPVQGSLV